ncbi:DNA polymerase III subunit gamma/tau [Opitutaceae bacterium EW11]|nr:DNA polymerase III subunit gamma/tau [Opitutaceae bacterium EW11]
MAEAATLPWPPALAGSPAIAVMERALERQRLSHSLLLTGDDIDTLGSIARALADRLLNAPLPGAAAPAVRFAPEQHPDFFALRPAGKMRQISAEATRNLIGKVQVSPTAAPRKVAIIYECDRMHVAASNIFLKTLEEPPANTTLLLLTTRPYSLLPTIRSRCLHFRFPTDVSGFSPDGWAPWLSDYRAWLERLVGGVTDKKAVTDSVFAAYGLVARFGTVLDAATTEIWKQQKVKLPPDLDEDEQVAIETGIANGIRARLFAEIELATRTFALPYLEKGDAGARRSLTNSVEKLEHAVGLLRLNLNESAALEEFLLASLRIWTRRA